jgi:hypothetical protein
MAPAADLTSMALSLLENWRQFLLVVRDNLGDGGEGLSNYIDIIEERLFSVEFDEYADVELASALRLVVELEQLIRIDLEDPERRIILDAHGEAMMRLATIMRTRGRHVSLPKVKPH